MKTIKLYGAGAAIILSAFTTAETIGIAAETVSTAAETVGVTLDTITTTETGTVTVDKITPTETAAVTYDTIAPIEPAGGTSNSIQFDATAIGILDAAQTVQFKLKETVRVTDENAYIYYESRAEAPLPKHTLAKYISKDYRNARDEFTRHDLFQQIEPVLSQRIYEAKNTERVLLKVRGNLGDYNFEKEAFPTGFGATTFIQFDHGYAASFVNGADIEFIEVAIGSARNLSSSLRTSRTANFHILGSIVGAEEQHLDKWTSRKMLKIKIDKLIVKHQSGVSVGVKSL